MAPKEKKSKKEKQLEKEAELARLAEEQRLQEEKEQKARDAEEALRQKEQAERQAEENRLQAELDERLEAESAVNAEWYASRVARLAAEQEVGLAATEWGRFIACSERPNVMSEAEVNAFLTEWRERSREDIWKTLPTCTMATELIASMDVEGAHAHDRGDEKMAMWQRELSMLIFEQLLSKLDGATADFMLHAEEYVNAKMECCVTVAARGCHFGLWVNLAKNPRVKSIEYANLNISVELPKSLALASIAVRIVQYETDFVSPYASPEAAAAATFMTLGGVVKIELLSLPPSAKKVKGWTMRPVTEMTHTVMRQQYPIPDASGNIPLNAPPLRITYAIPKNVILQESEPQRVGWWDDKVQQWKLDEISDIAYTPETRTISFDTLHLTSLALLQHTHLELPYKNWLISPTTASSGELYLQTSGVGLVHISISANGTVLKAPRLPELKELLDTPLPASTLLIRLRAAGINLMPRDVDATQLERVTPKDASLEVELHDAIAPLAARYHLCSSRWNPSRGHAKGTLRFAVKEEGYGDEAPSTETPAEPFAVIQPEWATLEYAKRRVLLIAATDADDTCDESALPETVAHSTPLECLKDRDPDLADVLLSSSRLYQDSVRQLMDNLRLLSFTQSA